MQDGFEQSSFCRERSRAFHPLEGIGEEERREAIRTVEEGVDHLIR